MNVVMSYFDGTDARDAKLHGKFDITGYAKSIIESGHSYMNTKIGEYPGRVHSMIGSAEGHEDNCYLVSWVDDECDWSMGQRCYEVVKVFTINGKTYIKGIDYTYGIGNVMGNIFNILEYVM